MDVDVSAQPMPSSSSSRAEPVAALEPTVPRPVPPIGLPKLPRTTWSSRAWPALHPAAVQTLPRAQTHPCTDSLPASRRYDSRLTLQDEADKLDIEEDRFFQSQHDIRTLGFSWLVPLGRSNTHEEDAESAFTASPLVPSVNGDITLEDAALEAEGDSADNADPAAAPAAATAGGRTGREVDLDADIEERDADQSEDSEAGTSENPEGRSDEGDDDEEEDDEDDEDEDAEHDEESISVESEAGGSGDDDEAGTEEDDPGERSRH